MVPPSLTPDPDHGPHPWVLVDHAMAGSAANHQGGGAAEILLVALDEPGAQAKIAALVARGRRVGATGGTADDRSAAVGAGATLLLIDPDVDGDDAAVAAVAAGCSGVTVVLAGADRATATAAARVAVDGGVDPAHVVVELTSDELGTGDPTGHLPVGARVGVRLLPPAGLSGEALDGWEIGAVMGALARQPATIRGVTLQRVRRVDVVLAALAHGRLPACTPAPGIGAA